MYKNVGERIKILAMAYAALLAVGSVVTGIILLTSENWFGLLFFFGPIASWALSLPLYGFGQLVSNSDKLVRESRESAKKLVIKTAGEDALFYCPFCGAGLKLKKEDFDVAKTIICPSCDKRIKMKDVQ